MTLQSDAELDLLERLRAGDSHAAGELATAYGARIHQLALRCMKNREDAEEVAQDVLLKVCRKVHCFRGDSALSSWIYRITFNAAMSRLRTARCRRPFEVTEDARMTHDDSRPRLTRDEADWSSLGDEAVLRRQMRERLEAAMRDLPPIYRIPIVLRDVYGLSTEEASQRLRVKTQTLKSRLHRGRLILRERLADFSTGLSLHPAS